MHLTRFVGVSPAGLILDRTNIYPAVKRPIHNKHTIGVRPFYFFAFRGFQWIALCSHLLLFGVGQARPPPSEGLGSSSSSSSSSSSPPPPQFMHYHEK